MSVAAVRHRRIDIGAVGEIGLLPEDGDKAELKVGDLLIVEGNGSLAHIGRVALWNGEIPGSRHQNHIIRVRSQGVDPRFLLEWLSSPRGRSSIISEATSASGLYTLSLKKVARLPVPLPPGDEQRCIVAKIEALFTRSRRAKEALDAIPPLLNRLRQSILAAAFRGDLTADWRATHPDVEPADKLLERIRTERRRLWEEAELAKMRAKGKEPKNDNWRAKYKVPRSIDTSEFPDLPANWVWTSVEEISTKVVDGVHKKPDYQTSGVPFVTVRNLTSGAGIGFDNIKYVSQESHERFCRRAKPEKGDILVSKDGTLGVTRLIETKREFSIFVSVALIKPLLGLGPYVRWALSSPNAQSNMVATGSGLQHIHLRDLRKVPIPLAPLNEQVEIAQRLSSMLTIERYVRERLQKASVALGQLESSVLATAFAGRLCPASDNEGKSVPTTASDTGSWGPSTSSTPRMDQMELPLSSGLSHAIDYTRDDWRTCLLHVVESAPIERDEAIRRAAEWARDNLGLEYKRLPKTGHIVKGLKSAMNSAIRRGELERVGSKAIRRP